MLIPTESKRVKKQAILTLEWIEHSEINQKD